MAKTNPVYQLSCDSHGTEILLYCQYEDENRLRKARPSLLGPLSDVVANGRASVRRRYRPAFCAVCHRLHPDDAFRLNLEDDAIVNAKKPGGYWSFENVFVVHEIVMAFARERQVQGLAFKQIGSKPWYVAHCTFKAQYQRDFLPRLRQEICSACKHRFLHHQNDTAIIRSFDFLQLPENPLTFFTNEIYSPWWMYNEGNHIFCTAPIFAQAELVKLLREQKKLKKFWVPEFGKY